MSALVFMILLVVIGMWNVTDGWFSLSLYLKDKNQTWYKDHYIRIIRMGLGVLAIYMGFYFGVQILGG